MKRVAYLLTIFTAVFIFLYLYQNISLNHFNAMNSLESSFSQATGKDHETIELSLLNDHGSPVLSELTDFLESKNYDAITFVQTRRHDFIIDTTAYLYSDLKLNELAFFKTVQGKNLDFTIEENNYYSSYLDDTKAYDVIDYVNSSYQKDYQPRLLVKPLTLLASEHPEKKTALVFIYGEDRVQIKNDIIDSEINKHVVSNESSLTFEFSTPDDLQVGSIHILLILTIASLVVITICESIALKKEITIRKLFGESDTSIYWDLFAKRYLINMVLYIFSQITLYFLIVKNFRPIHLLLLKPLLVAFGLYLLFWIAANALSYIMLTVTGRPSNIKNNSTLKFSGGVAVVLKLLLLILIVTPFIALIKTAPLMMEENSILRKNKLLMQNNLVIEGILLDNTVTSLESWEPLQQTLKVVESQEWMYHDFSSNFLPDEIKETIPEEVYKRQFVQHPYIVANERYLKNYNIRDLNNNLIDFRSIEQNTLLVPERYKDEKFTDVYFGGGDGEILYIKNPGTLYNLAPLSPDLSLKKQKDPVILLKKGLDASMQWNGSSLTIKDSESARTVITDFLATNGLNNRIFISNTNQEYDTALSRSNDQVRAFILVLGLYILMIYIFQYQSVFIYFYENKEKVAVNYLFGKSYFQRYGYMFISSLAVYFLSLVLGMEFMELDRKYLIVFILLGIFFDFMIAGIMIKSFEKKRTLSVLKGE